MKRDTTLLVLAVMPGKSSYIIADKIQDVGLEKLKIWRFRSDEDKSFSGHVAAELKKRQIATTDTGGYDPQSNRIAENAIGRVGFAGRGLALQASEGGSRTVG